MKKGLLKTSIRLLTKKFSVLPSKITEKLQELDAETLEIIIDDIFIYENLDDLDKFIK